MRRTMNERRFHRGLLGIGVALLMSVGTLNVEARGRSGVQVYAVDEEGNALPGIELAVKPVGETTGSVQTVKTDRRGRFSTRFLPSGQYIIDIANPDEHFVKEAKVEVNDAGGVLLKEYDITVHPVQGMTPIPVMGGQMTEMTLVVTNASYRNRLLSQVEAGAIKDEVNDLLRLYNEGNLEDALALGEQVMAEMTTDIPQVLHLVGMVHVRLNQFDQAEPLLRRAIEKAPDLPEYKASLGTMFLEMARQKHAREENAQAEFVEAEEWLSLAVSEMKPAPVQLLVNQSIALEGSGKSEAAIEVMERILSEDQSNMAVRFRMAALLRASGQPERALEILDKLPGGGDPRAAESLYNIGLTFFNDEDYPSAVAALTRAAEIDPDHAIIQRLLGRTYYAMGEPKKALPHLERFIQLDPDHPEAAMEKEMVDYLRKTTK